jgi:hypothetical protein
MHGEITTSSRLSHPAKQQESERLQDYVNAGVVTVTVFGSFSLPEKCT